MPSQAVLELLVTLKDQASSGLSSLAGAVGNLGMVAGGVALAGVAALGAAVVSGVGDAREAAKVYAQTEAVIKSTGGAAGVSADQVADLAASLSASSGKSLFGDDAIQQSTNLLLTFTELKGGVLDAATAISVDMAQAMGGAPKDAAIQLGKALNDPIKGVTALSKVGVAFTEQQKSQIKAMQEAGDMAGAQTIILNELNKEFGGSAQAAADADGGWAQITDRLGEAAETVGAALLPVLGMLSGFLVDTIVPAVESAATAFSAWLADPAVQEGLATIAAAIQTGLAVAFDFLANQAIPALVAAWALIQPAIAAILPLFTSDLPSGLQSTGETFNVLQGVITAVMSAIQAVVSAVLPQIVAFWQANGDEIMSFVKTTWDTIMGIIQTAMQIIQAIIVPILAAIAGFINAHGTEIQAILKATWDYISGVIGAALGLIQGLLKTVLLAINGDWSGAWEMLKQTSANFVQAILDTVTTVMGDLEGVFNSTIDSIKSAWDGFASDAAALGKNIVDGIINGVEGAAGALYRTLKDMAGNALQAAKDALGISSPSAVAAAQIGVPLVQGIAMGIGNATPSLFDTIAQVGGDMMAILKQALKDGSKTAKGLISDLEDSMKDAIKLAHDIGGEVNDALAAGYAAEGSFDRQIAKNLDAISKVSAAQRNRIQEQLQAAQATAAQITDPASGAKYLKMRSDQIFELAKLQDSLNEANSEEERARIQQQIQLISAAQVAEQNAFAVNDRDNVSPQQKLIDEIKALLGNDMFAVLDNPVITMFRTMLQQLQASAGGFGAGAPLAGGAASGPADSRGNVTISNTFNLPAGSDRGTVDAVVRELNRQVSGRRS